MQRIISKGHMYYRYGNAEDVKDSIESFIDANVSDTYQAYMREFLDIDTINGRLGDKNIISQEYQDVNEKWIRCSFIPSKKTSDGKNIIVICGLRDVTQEKQVELEHAEDGIVCVDMLEKADSDYYDIVIMDIHMQPQVAKKCRRVK